MSADKAAVEPIDALDAGILGLIALYDEIASEPVPERLTAALDEAAEKPAD